ncbi:MAG TPA: alpha/beta hydrolase [Xanthobacteraceae bacterium]|nr:alpha/beta hydrolase [Xanthobacteraceae bacterium]
MATAAVSRARHFHADPTVGRRLEQAGTRVATRSHPDAGRRRAPAESKAARRINVWRDVLERNLLQISAALFFVGSVGWCWLIFNEIRSTVFAPVETAYALTAKVDAGVGKSDAYGTSTFERTDRLQTAALSAPSLDGPDSPASIVAREWSRFEALHTADRRAPAKQVTKAASLKPPVRLASLETPGPLVGASAHSPSNLAAETSLVDFETAPFPYHGVIPGSNRPFLNVSEDGRLGHTNFRGHVFWEAQTFSDDRVLLHVPPGFDPKRPAVIVVFFHGHGANLARDVRDRQQVPAQITAAGANAVLVAPQFAFDAPDSSAGKFWEANGFKHFLDEAAVKLARLYGDPRSAATFARMPIVIVAYSGGFGPTLAVLDRGGVRSRVRGLVLLDALYGGIDKFADWIADNRSTFFVSSYTPHTAHHNADLERLLRERSVPYGSELRPNRLPGMVAFLPAGDVSHRDFVTHAWADNPIEDILARMTDVNSKFEGAETTASISPNAAGINRN